MYPDIVANECPTTNLFITRHVKSDPSRLFTTIKQVCVQVQIGVDEGHQHSYTVKYRYYYAWSVLCSDVYCSDEIQGCVSRTKGLNF